MKRWNVILAWGLVVTSACAQFYYPDSEAYGNPGRYGLEYEDVYFKSADGTRLHGWFVPATTSVVGTVVHFHGNAQNVSAHFSFVKWLPRQGYQVFAFDYRGYGKSSGEPSRRGVHEDSVAALNYALARPEVDPASVFVLGQSLGGANAVDAIVTGGHTNLCGVVLESAFYSYKRVAKDKVPDILAGLFVSDDYSPGPILGGISPMPLLIVHGTADRIVDYKHAKLLEAAAKEPKTLWTIRGGRHTEAFGTRLRAYGPRLLRFFAQCRVRRKQNTAEGNADE